MNLTLVMLTQDELDELSLNGRVILTEPMEKGEKLTETTREFAKAILELTDEQILDRSDDTI